MTGSRAQAGFTMVEIMVVVAIIGIMAGIGIPSFIAVMPRIRLNSNVMVLSNEIALSRVRAISKSTDFRIVFDTAEDTFETEKFTAGAWQSIATARLGGSDLFSAAGLTPAGTLITYANGQMNVPLGEQRVIELRTPDGQNRKRIVVEAVGRVVVQRWDGAAWVED